MVVRSGKSKFPDLIAVAELTIQEDTGIPIYPAPLIIESKKGKYIDAEERVKFKEWAARGLRLVAYPKQNAQDKRKTDIIFCDLDYKEVMRL